MSNQSGVHAVRRQRVLLAHDVNASTCNFLIDVIEAALGHITESSSVDDAREALHTAPFDLAMVCLDLPPAPLGGARLARELVDEGLPVILVTRSMRWIPRDATALLELPWITPDAPVDEMLRVFDDATAPHRRIVRAPAPSGRRLARDLVRESDVPARIANGR